MTIAVPLVSADTSRAGAAQSVITPELNGHAVYLAGFGHNRVATGMHDDLYARCLALGIAKQTLVVCSVDLIGLFYDDVLTIRQAFQQTTPAGSVLIVASTHTHAGPDTLGLYGPKPLESGIDPKYLDWVDQRIDRHSLGFSHFRVGDSLPRFERGIRLARWLFLGDPIKSFTRSLGVEALEARE